MSESNNSAWERINQIIRHYSFPSVSAFARHIGLKRGENLYQIKRGKNGISRELAQRITHSFPNISQAWILTGEGAMLPETDKNFILNEIFRLPFYQNFPFNRPPGEPDKHLYLSKELTHNADFAVTCRTDELLPLYKRDTILFLRQWVLNNPIIYGEVYFIITDYCSVFRIIRKSPKDNHVMLESPNKEKYDNLSIPREDIKELYLVV